MVPEIPPTLRPLTVKEKKVLEFVENYLRHEGIAPSYREIKDHFGFASFNSVQRYLKQLQAKGYIHIPGGNQKRAITLLQSSYAVQTSMVEMHSTIKSLSQNNVVSTNPFVAPPFPKEASTVPSTQPLSGSLSLPLYGRVAAGIPIEALDHNEFVEVPPTMIRYPEKSFALKVEGESMIEDAILDGDTILVQEQQTASSGELVVAVVDNEATVKRIYFHKKSDHFFNNESQIYSQFPDINSIELRPSNKTMSSLWYKPGEVKISGIVIGLLRQFH